METMIFHIYPLIKDKTARELIPFIVMSKRKKRNIFYRIYLKIKNRTASPLERGTKGVCK